MAQTDLQSSKFPRQSSSYKSSLSTRLGAPQGANPGLTADDEDGTLELAAKETVDSAPEGFEPWFYFPRNDDVRVVFGHWAALEGKTGSDRFIGLDTGCVWGGALTMMNLDTGEKIHCDC